jgi:uncharacterized membrane protein YeaQ/YmgE (transglycosylase-associated protein family)
MAILIPILVIVGVLTGWLAPRIFKSRPPYGLGVDIVASVICMVGLGVPEWLWILPALGMGFESGWLRLVATIGDSFSLALIVLWLLRKIRGL